VSAMAAQNIGAERWDRVTRITHSGLLLNVAMTSALVLLVSAVNRPVAALFLGDNPEAVEIAVHIHRVVSWSFVLFGASIVLSSTVRATGAVMAPLFILVTSLWLVRIPFAAALGSTWHAESIWWSFPVGSVTSLVLITLYYRFGNWRAARMMPVNSRSEYPGIPPTRRRSWRPVRCPRWAR